RGGAVRNGRFGRGSCRSLRGGWRRRLRRHAERQPHNDRADRGHSKRLHFRFQYTVFGVGNAWTRCTFASPDVTGCQRLTGTRPGRRPTSARTRAASPITTSTFDAAAEAAILPCLTPHRRSPPTAGCIARPAG